MTNTAIKALEAKIAAEKNDIERKKLEQDLKRLKFEEKKANKDRRARLVGQLFSPVGNVIGAAIKKQDPEWYKRYLTNLDQYTNVATYHRLGLPTSINEGTSSKKESSFPVIAVTHINPSLGGQDPSIPVSQFPINQILMRMKEQVLKSNSRSNVPYEASDLGYNLLATASIMASICDALRAYYISQWYSATNSVVPVGLLKALGWDPDNVIRNRADFRKTLQLIIRRFNSACVAPSELTLYKRWIYLSSNVFKDSDIEPYQLFAYHFDWLWQLSNDGSKLEVVYTEHTDTVATWYKRVSGMIQRISENPDFIAMYADLRSAFHDDIYQLDPVINEDYNFEPSFDKMAREQWHNIRTLPIVASTISKVTHQPDYMSVVSGEVNQTNEGFLFQGATTGPKKLTYQVPLPHNSSVTIDNFKTALSRFYAYDTGAQCFDLYADKIDGDQILDATRFTPMGDFELETFTDQSNNKSYIFKMNIRSCGTEIAVGTDVYRCAPTAEDGPQMLKFKVGSIISLVYNTSPSDYYLYILQTGAAASGFDWFYPIVATYTGGTNDIQMTFQEVGHPFDVANPTLAKINEACVLSEFYINSQAFKR